MPAIGFVTRQDDDSYQGELSTLTVQADLELRPNQVKVKAAQPDYLVFAKGMEIGFGWKKISQATGREYVTLRLATPEFGAKPIAANLGAVPGESSNYFAIIWNPEP
jgi:uncharacterized protein (DUF736 family)